MKCPHEALQPVTITSESREVYSNACGDPTQLALFGHPARSRMNSKRKKGE
jgi:hypothetical protein